MWDAAPARRTFAAVAMLASILWLCSGAAAEIVAETTPVATTPIWAAELTNAQAKGLSVDQVYALRSVGLTSFIIDRSRFDRRSREHAQYLAEMWNLLVIEVTDRTAVRRCNLSFARAGQRACALVANSVEHGMALARMPGTHLIIVRVTSVKDVRRLTTVRSRGRFVALGRLGARNGFSLADWQTAVQSARSGAGLHLGAAAGTPAATVARYFRSLAKVTTETTNSPPTSGSDSPSPAPTATPPVSGDSGVAKLPSTSGAATPTPAPTATPPASGSSGLANLFIDSDGGTCTRSGSLVAYNDASACSTLKNSYIAASLGDTVRIKCGTYAGETINGATTSKGTPDSVLARVVFLPENDTLGCVNITGNLQVDVPHIEFQKITLTGAFGCAYRSDLSQTKGGNCHLISSDVGGITISSIRNFRIAGNDIGPPANADGIQILGYPAFDGHHSQYGTIEDNYVHDQVLDLTCGGTSPPAACDPHIDALQFTTGEDMIVRRNVFRGGQQAILAQADQGPIGRYTIEGNLIIDYTGGFSVWLKNKVGQTCAGNVFNYNTSDREFTASNVAAERCSGTMTGNIWPSLATYGCYNWLATFTVSYMVFGSGPTCGSNGYVLPSGFNAAFIDVATNNYHLSASSAARGKGNPSVCPATDIDGDARPSASICDAGSDDVP